MTLDQIEWAASTLAMSVVQQNPHLSDAVIVVTLKGGLGGALEYESSWPRSGRRIVRLQYPWDLAVAVAACGTIWDARALLRDQASPGNVLRARVREARETSYDQGRAASFRRRQKAHNHANITRGVVGDRAIAAGQTRAVGHGPTQALLALTPEQEPFKLR